MKKHCLIAPGVLSGLFLVAGNSALFAVITPADQLGVTNGGVGTTIISTADLQNEIGFGLTANDTVAGTFTYSFTIEFTQLANGTGESGFTGFQLYKNGGEQFAVGESWPSTVWGGFRAPGGGNYELLDENSATVPLALNTSETFIVSIDMVAGGNDTVTVSFRGEDTVFTGPVNFDEVRVRCGNDNQVANFTNISFEFNSPDLDDDGLPDDYEEAIISAAASQNPPVILTLTDIKGPNDAPETSDYDGDLLFDHEEIGLSTNPTLADTDGDLLTDYDEVNTHSSSPILVDTDGDLLTDGDEVKIYESDPTTVDTDLDGVSDGLEVSSGSSPADIDDLPAVLKPLDQIAITDGGNGVTVIDPTSLAAYLGEVPDNFVGTITYSAEIEFTELANGNGAEGFTGLQLYLGNEERMGVGDYWLGTNWGGFKAPDTNEFEFQNLLGAFTPLAVNAPENITVVLEMATDGDDTATVIFRDLDTTFTGLFDFDQLRVRCGNAGQVANFTSISLQIGQPTSAPLEIKIITHDPASQMTTFSWDAISGTAYATEFSTDLENWDIVDDFLTAAGSEMTVTYSLTDLAPPMDAKKVFFRVLLAE